MTQLAGLDFDMSASPLPPQQLRAALVRCSAQLANIVRRSCEHNPNARVIGSVYHGELHDVVVHAFVALQGLPTGAGRYRNLIARTYAGGVDGATSALTVESVQSINDVLGMVVAQLGNAEH